MTTAISKLDPQFAEHEIEMVAPTPMQLIQQVLAVGGNAMEMATVIKELVALQQSQDRFQWEREDRQAKIDFDNAMTKCQKAIGRIAPNQSRGDTKSMWADYAQLDRAVRPIYTAEEFSISFREVASLAPGKVRIEAEVSRSGISKLYHAEITPSTTGPQGKAMATATDADAIAQSRAKRYIMLDIFNIAVGIDAIEKAGLTPADGDYLQELIDQMKNSETLPDCKEAYGKAYAKARELKNNDATLKIIDTFEQCKVDFARAK